MPQLSFFSAEAAAPCLGDLAGVLCARGRMAGFARTAARLSITVDSRWRARALAAALAERGVSARLEPDENESVALHTPFRTDLTPLADAWTRDTTKTIPPGLTLTGGPLRLWVLTAGSWLEGSYLLELDPDAPQTHEPLVAALARAGLRVGVLTPPEGNPSIKVTGRRRLSRLVELVGTPPDRHALEHWPASSRVHAMS
ncbi:hypothetical protein [Labedaea rhizosphaerae]|uniref:Uncharacterized protein n=1 Tax=Labedaea rhizosphaerae TaxID=598644 RepID=A0A4R6SK49_LABRH|nr:hypothetical protein [Labedaea rhizosphaerae]TDQ04736.1 hypothetical protein EV186_101692 [Labedaea rhizosphaerae]